MKFLALPHEFSEKARHLCPINGQVLVDKCAGRSYVKFRVKNTAKKHHTHLMACDTCNGLLNCQELLSLQMTHAIMVQKVLGYLVQLKVLSKAQSILHFNFVTF